MIVNSGAAARRSSTLTSNGPPPGSLTVADSVADVSHVARLVERATRSTRLVGSARIRRQLEIDRRPALLADRVGHLDVPEVRLPERDIA